MPKAKTSATKKSAAKTALCVGINDYPGTNSDLAGCVNDAKDWRRALELRGFTVRTLLDKQATAKAMRSALTELVSAAKKGDTAIFTYSGHGSWLPDDDGDEADSRDEMLCPYDVYSGGALLDDDLNEIFSARAAGVRLVFISDSCHSGSVSKFFPPPREVAANYARPRFLHPRAFVKSKKMLKAIDRVVAQSKTPKAKYPALLAAGCKDTDYSWDARFGNRPNGAFTYFALQALSKSPKSYSTWMKSVRTKLPNTAHPQSPSLYGASASKGWSVL
jgi:hypothetical protein